MTIIRSFSGRRAPAVLSRFFALIAAASSWCPARADQAPPSVSVSPRPVVEKVVGGTLRLAGRGQAVLVRVTAGPRSNGPIDEAMKLLSRRCTILGFKVTGTAGNESSMVTLNRRDRATMAEALRRNGVTQEIDATRLRQAYTLAIASTPDGSARVTLQATDDWGLFYGVVSLCQLIDVDKEGALVAPGMEIADYPEIAHRLAKTSASDPPSFVARYAAWLPMFKISQLGLQYHGANSKQPSSEFTANIQTICPSLRRAGTLESIVYFCPFRGKGPRNMDHLEGSYDLSSPADRKAYTDYLLWIMAQGPNGIEVDYNDWPGSKEVPIADVLKLACDAVREKYPEAYILYCPPNRGPEAYNAMATPQMHDTLSRVPEAVWPLWVGLPTRTMSNPETAKPLTAQNVEQWTEIAGRRPFLWINRVAANVKWSLSRPVPGADGHVFAGDLLPRQLNRLFEGVHLNTGRLSLALLEGRPREQGNEPEHQFDREELVYLATAADFLWNPAAWEATDSYRRATRFVQVMSQLVSEQATSAPANSR